MATTIHQTQDVGTLQYIFPQISPSTKKSSNHPRGREVHQGGTEHLQRTATPNRRAPQSYILPQHNREKDAEPEL